MRLNHVKRPKSHVRLHSNLKRRVVTRIKPTRTSTSRDDRIQAPPDCRPEIW